MVTATVVEHYRAKKILIWKYRPGLRYRRRRLLPQAEGLAVDAMAARLLLADRGEGVEAHVQGDEGDGDPPVPQSRKKPRREMQAGRGGGRGALPRSEDSLVAFGVAQRLLDVGRGGHPADAPDLVESRLALQADPAGLLFPTENRYPQRRALEVHHRARRQLPGRPDERFPLAPGQRPQQQDLGRRAAAAAAQQPGRQHPRVVEHQDVTGFEVVGQVEYQRVLDGGRTRVEHQHPRRVALDRRALRDQAGGQLVVEVSRPHWWTAGPAGAGTRSAPRRGRGRR